MNIFAIGEQMAKDHAELKRKVSEVIGRLTISELDTLLKAITNPKFAGLELHERVMGAEGKKVRVAEWHVVDGACQHKRYSVGNLRRAEIGNTGDKPCWIEAWIA